MPELNPIPLKRVDVKQLPSKLTSLLRSYRILHPKGGLTQVELRRAKSSKGEPIGRGPIMQEDVLQRIIDADKSTYKEWVPWMLHIAGGGDDAKRRSSEALNQIKERFIDERMRGYRDKSGAYHDPVGEREAKAQWDAFHARCKEILDVGDQDMVEKLSVFGWFQNWPGRDRIYERLVNAVNKFFAVRKKIAAMNNYLEKDGQTAKTVSLAPSGYAGVDSLESALKRVERFYASRQARRDVRADTIYDDENVEAIVPLTYAAAVKYGSDAWAFSNREKFEKGLEGTMSSWEDTWRGTTGREHKVFVFLRFKTPMPSWISTAEGDKTNPFKRYYLTDLALELDPVQLKGFNPDTVKLYDEENKTNLTLNDIKNMVRDEAQREYDPEEEEMPIMRGPRVYQTQEEAEAVVKSLERALDAVKDWARTFRIQKVVSDYMPAER